MLLAFCCLAGLQAGRSEHAKAGKKQAGHKQIDRQYSADTAPQKAAGTLSRLHRPDNRLANHFGNSFRRRYVGHAPTCFDFNTG